MSVVFGLKGPGGGGGGGDTFQLELFFHVSMCKCANSCNHIAAYFTFAAPS